MVSRHDTYEMLHDLLKKTILNNPQISEGEAKEELWGLVSGNQDVFRLLYDNWFNANFHRYEPHIETITTKDRATGRRVKGQSVTVVRRTYATPERKEQRKVVARGIIAKAAPMIFMNLPMPNGKTLGECTGAECLKIGGWVTLVGRQIGATQKVAKRLSETDLQNLYMRNAA